MLYFPFRLQTNGEQNKSLPINCPEAHGWGFGTLAPVGVGGASGESDRLECVQTDYNQIMICCLLIFSQHTQHIHMGRWRWRRRGDGGGGRSQEMVVLRAFLTALARRWSRPWNWCWLILRDIDTSMRRHKQIQSGQSDDSCCDQNSRSRRGLIARTKR